MLLRVMGSDLDIEFGPERAVNKVPRRLADTSAARARPRVRRPRSTSRPACAASSTGGAPSARPSLAVARDADPDHEAVLHRRRGRGGRRGRRVRLGVAGAAGARVRGGVRGARRRRRRGRDDELHDRAPARAVRGRAWARATRSSSLAVVHRHGQRGLAVRRDAGLRRHRPAHLQPRPGRGRAGDHAAHARRSCPSTRSACPPTWTRSSSSAGATASQIVEDAACAIGATYKGRPIGSLGPMACFSLHPRKVITTGEGGMITVQDPELAARLRFLRQHAMDVSDLARHAAERRRDRALSRARLELPDDRHAGGARALPARGARRDPRRAGAGSRSATPLRSTRCRRCTPRTTRRTPERTWQSYCVRVDPRLPRDAHGADAAAARRRHRDAARRHGDPPRGGLFGRGPVRSAAHRRRRAPTSLMLPHLSRPHGRGAGLRDRATRRPPTPWRWPREDGCPRSWTAGDLRDRTASLARGVRRRLPRARPRRHAGAAARARPLLLLIALIVKLDSPGPVLFRQQRVGRNQRQFMVAKFRTMHHGADHDVHRDYMLALIESGNAGAEARRRRARDPLRRLPATRSLDELPQLWNVLRGEMSLVGPRPPIPYEVEHYPPHWFARFAVKPGVTGLWQVSGRSEVSLEEMIELDVEYVRRRSVLFEPMDPAADGAGRPHHERSRMMTLRRIVPTLAALVVAALAAPATAGAQRPIPARRPVTNEVACENTQAGTPESVWGIDGTTATDTLQGYRHLDERQPRPADLVQDRHHRAGLHDRHLPDRLLRRRRRAPRRHRPHATSRPRTSRRARPTRRPA